MRNRCHQFQDTCEFGLFSSVCLLFGTFVEGEMPDWLGWIGVAMLG